jgi:thiamine biosynthesis lipoprotein
MPLLETLPITPGCTQWELWGTVARIVVTDPDRLEYAAELIRTELDAVEVACSRFRTDSEVHDVARAGGRPVRVSARLADLVGAGLHAARATDGDVDPTLGAAMDAIGYDRDFDAIRPAGHPPLYVHRHTDWRDVHLDGTELTVPAGTLLDLGATAKAWAADRCAALAASACGTGVLVALGGDIATAGAAPGGWPVLVRDGADQPACTVLLPCGAALATSSTISRSWSAGRRRLHHILDPRTGRPAPRRWRTVSVAAVECVRANTLSTAAIVRGEHALPWLRSLGVPARLVATDGTVTTVGSWPA